MSDSDGHKYITTFKNVKDNEIISTSVYLWWPSNSEVKHLWKSWGPEELLYEIMLSADKHIFQLIDLHLKSLRWFGSYPFYLDKHSKHLVYGHGGGKEKFKTHILLILTALTWIQIHTGKKTKDFSLAVVLENMVYVGAESVFIVVNYVYFKRHGMITELFNMLVYLESKDKYYQSKSK